MPTISHGGLHFAGAKVLVAGSYIFRNDSYVTAIDNLRAAGH